MNAAIHISNLSVTIEGKNILTDVTLRVPTGKIVGLLGPSGAGKTTLIRAILGLQKISDGDVSVLGFPAGTPQLRSQVGYVTQTATVYPDLTIKENMSYFATLMGTQKEQVLHILTEVELNDYANQMVASLSGGQKTRVSLAVALLGRPKLLLLDEPTVGLDPVLRQKLWAYFRELADQGITVIISSHMMDEADKCDELFFLRDGTLLAAGTPHEIIRLGKTKTLEDAFLKLALGVRQ